MPYDDHARALKLLHALDLDVWGTKVEAIVESTNYETLTTDELFSKLKSKEIDIQFRKKLNNPTAGSSSNIPMALVSGSTNTNANLSSTPSFALSSLCHIADDELEVFDDDQLVLLTNKFKRVYENRRNRRRSEGCFNCGERGHFIADCPSKVKAPEHGNSYRRQEQSRDRKNKSDRRGRKKGQQKFTDKQIKKAAHVLFSSLGSFDSDASYNSSDSESEDEKPKKTNDGGLCFLADIKGGMCTMALNEGDAYDCSNDSSDNEVQNSAEEEIEELTKLVDKQNKILARLKADHDRISAELKTLKDATPAAVECEECSIHMVSISELQSKHAVLVDKFDCAKIELEELRSRSVLLGACATCPILQTELNVAKCHIVQLEKHTCPILPECLTCPTFVAEISILKKDNAALEEENTHLRTILGWCSVREPQIGMTIAQIKRGEHFGVGYDLKRTFGKKNAYGENNGPTPSEKSPPVSSEGFVVEPPKSVPKKQDGGEENIWIMDSGCSRHMTGDDRWFSSLTPASGNLDKFESRSSDGLFLGYALQGRAYRVLNLDTNRIEETCEVTFDETMPCFSSAFECAGDDEIGQNIFEDEVDGLDDDDDATEDPAVLELQLRGRQLLLEQHLDIFSVAIHLNK
ncbi:uncharacterized protein LOC120695619 [Panicum virgatum]|uniref:uncharacterized protein LOC120647746 n=1 Tax=Panicum virgatum TaxID=38727 RepID=UPI0019D60FCC|nr:uncharacterized protein LOC120647746 [Panicum virgatum]XP_039797411.1 uncharacterized protein LOC120662299 [Panicum virgatum]XP_039834752.1 uncharacterized protein LOC120695619 [Panicum virgatum]